MTDPTPDLPRVTELVVKNYRVLRDVRFAGLTPLTALIGPNGSGKSTVLNALAFLAEAVTDGPSAAWSRRGDQDRIRSFGTSGPVEIDVTGTPGGNTGMFRYHLSLDEERYYLAVRRETLSWRPTGDDDWTPLLRFRDGEGTTYLDGREQDSEQLAEEDALALTTFGGLDRYRQLVDFRRFVANISVGKISPDEVRRGEPVSRPTQSLLPSGENLPQMVRYLRNDHPETFDVIIRSLRRYVPNLADVEVQEPQPGSLLLRVKDVGFDQGAVPDSTSDGTLKLLAYLVSLWEPQRGSVLLVEEPENFVHHRLLQLIAEDTRAATERGQVLVATHSPYFVDALRPDEVWVTYRGADGYTKAQRAADLPRLVSMVDSGGALGDLWAEGYFDQGDPLAEPS